ncbi:hypothetical protein ACFVTC_31970 [Streptomyces sp. NPDC057950]|uniref:hypothetical protein n=1 Tax=Streptomyces sp. NPDC057950 TaxID=3346288 RepID=UPI0036E9FA6B
MSTMTEDGSTGADSPEWLRFLREGSPVSGHRGSAGPSADGVAVAVRDLFVGESLLGDRSRFVQEGGVMLLKVDNYRVTAADFPGMAARRAGSERRRLELLKFTFMLRELPAGRRYETARVRIVLRPQPPLMLLRPHLTYTDPRAARGFGSEFRPALTRLLGMGDKHTRSGGVGRVDRLPVVTGVDEGPAGFGWTFQAQDGAPLVPQRAQTVVVAELPLDALGLAGTFDAEAFVARRVAGIHESRRALPRTPPATFTVALPTVG